MLTPLSGAAAAELSSHWAFEGVHHRVWTCLNRKGTKKQTSINKNAAPWVWPPFVQSLVFVHVVEMVSVTLFINSFTISEIWALEKVVLQDRGWNSWALSQSGQWSRLKGKRRERESKYIWTALEVFSSSSFPYVQIDITLNCQNAWTHCLERTKQLSGMQPKCSLDIWHFKILGAVNHGYFFGSRRFKQQGRTKSQSLKLQMLRVLPTYGSTLASPMSRYADRR